MASSPKATPGSRTKNGQQESLSGRQQLAASDEELDWHDVSLITKMLELTPMERIRRGQELARQMVAFRNAVADQLH